MKQPFEILEHPSDLGIEAYGNSMQELFRNAAKGLISIIAGNSDIIASCEREISIPATDRENLMVRWLAEILFLYDSEKFLLSDVKFEVINDNSMKAVLQGEIYDPLKHELSLDVKAITYHQLKLEECDGLWIARVFVDI
jgi:SHS2 domain-containing protein